MQRYQPPHHPTQAAQLLLLTHTGEKITAIVHPETHALRGVITEQWRPTNLARAIHGGLMLGTVGEVIVETVACWVIIMIITGLYLWWKRHGHIIPRLQKSGRSAWRE